MRLRKRFYFSGFSLMEILVAISILGIAATAGYQSFYSIERMQYQAVKATQNIDKPVAAFNQFFAQYNQSEENSTAIEVLDLTPNIDAFINTNRFRLDRVRVLLMTKTYQHLSLVDIVTSSAINISPYPYKIGL